MRKLDETSRITIGDFDNENATDRIPWFFRYCGVVEKEPFLTIDPSRVIEISDDDIKECFLGYDD